MLQHLGQTPAIKQAQILPKLPAHLVGAGALLARWRLEMLMDVVVLQPLEGGQRVVQTTGGHAPSADRSAHQIHRLGGLGQPVVKQKTVQRAEDQPLGTTGGGWDDAHVLGTQTVLLDVLARFRPGVEAKCLERSWHGARLSRRPGAMPQRSPRVL